jgi:hypothetical protein
VVAPCWTGDGVTGALNHLSVKVSRSAEVGAATERLTGQGLATLTQDAPSRCCAVQDKVWVHDPDGASWEVYTVLADAPSDTSGEPAEPVGGAAIALATPGSRSDRPDRLAVLDGQRHSPPRSSQPCGGPGRRPANARVRPWRWWRTAAPTG